MRTLFLVAACLVMGVATVASASPVKPTATPDLRPIYVPSPRSDVYPVCGGSTVLAQIDYWPVEGEQWYEARFVGNGGMEGGSVTLAIGGDFENGVDLPADGMNHSYTVDLNIPAPAGVVPLQILVYATGGPCLSTDSAPLRVRSLNVFAVAP